MNYWDSVGRWINTLLLFIVGIIAFDTLFRLLEAQEGNVIVGVVRVVATLILVPFEGMFSEQRFELTALMAILMYCVLAGIGLAVLRSLQATHVPRRRAYDPSPPPQRRPSQPAAERERAARRGRNQPVRPADAQPAVAQRPATRRATTRPEQASKAAPTAKPPSRTPGPRRAAAEPAEPSTTDRERNGRPATGRSDDGAPRRDTAAAANGADGATTRPAATRPATGNGERASATDATDKSSDRARAAPAGARAATETTPSSGGKPRDGEGSDDRPR